MNLEMEMRDREYLARREGRAEGRVEGIAEGRAEEKEFTAMNLLEMNLTLEQVYRATKLPMERIIELAKRLKH